MKIERLKLNRPTSFTAFVEDNDFTLVLQETPDGFIKAKLRSRLLTGSQPTGTGLTEEKAVRDLIINLKPRIIKGNALDCLKYDCNL